MKKTEIDIQKFRHTEKLEVVSDCFHNFQLVNDLRNDINFRLYNGL